MVALKWKIYLHVVPLISDQIFNSGNKIFLTQKQKSPLSLIIKLKTTWSSSKLSVRGELCRGSFPILVVLYELCHYVMLLTVWTVMPTDEGEIVGAVRTKLKTKQRWSIMFLARTADTEAVNTAKQEKMQVCSLLIMVYKPHTKVWIGIGSQLCFHVC